MKVCLSAGAQGERWAGGFPIGYKWKATSHVWFSVYCSHYHLAAETSASLHNTGCILVETVRQGQWEVDES